MVKFNVKIDSVSKVYWEWIVYQNNYRSFNRQSITGWLWPLFINGVNMDSNIDKSFVIKPEANNALYSAYRPILYRWSPNKFHKMGVMYRFISQSSKHLAVTLCQTSNQTTQDGKVYVKMAYLGLLPMPDIQWYHWVSVPYRKISLFIEWMESNNKSILAIGT